MSRREPCSKGSRVPACLVRVLFTRMCLDLWILASLSGLCCFAPLF